MKLKNILIVVGLLLAASAAVYFLQRPPPPAAQDPRVQQPVLDSALATKAGQLRFTDQGKTVQLAKQPDGSWRVPSYFDFPADFSKLSRLISDLTDAKIQRLVTTRPDRLARLEFKDTSVALLDGADKELWTITLGKNAEFGGRYLRYGKEQKGYQANLNLSLDAEAKNWADTTLLNLKPDDIAKVEVGFTGGANVAASRAKKDDPWVGASAPAGKQLKTDKITSILGNLTALRFSDTSDPKDATATAAREHSRTVKLTTFDSKTYTVALGRKPEEKKPKPPAPKPAEVPQPVGGVPPPRSDVTAPATPAADAPPASPVAGVTDPGQPAPTTPPAAPKPVEPEFETIPAGPVFAVVTSSDDKAPVNALMQKRAFQIGEWTFTSLPEKADDCWEDKPAPPPPAPKPEEKPVTATPAPAPAGAAIPSAPKP